MDDFASVLKKGASGTGKGTVLLAAGLMSGILGALGLIQYTEIGQSMMSDTASMSSFIMVTVTVVLPLIVLPYILGGVLGHAVARSSGGNPGWPEFFESARKHYLTLFFAGIIAYVIYMILGLAAVSVLYLGLSGSLIFCGLALPIIIIVLFCMMVIEFYDIAIVSEGHDFIKGFKASVAFARKHMKIVLPFFIIAIIARILVQLPVFVANELKIMAELAANYSYYFNETANATNLSLTNTTMLAGQVNTFSVPSLLAIAALQIIAQAVVFAFLISYKAEFYRWAKSIKSITDFDYDFSDEKKA